MLIELFFNPIFILINKLVGLIPVLPETGSWVGQTASMLAKPLSIFPTDIWVAIFVNVIAWLAIDFVWAIIEWAYKKIPGID